MSEKPFGYGLDPNSAALAVLVGPEAENCGYKYSAPQASCATRVEIRGHGHSTFPHGVAPF